MASEAGSADATLAPGGSCRFQRVGLPRRRGWPASPSSTSFYKNLFTSLPFLLPSLPIPQDFCHHGISFKNHTPKEAVWNVITHVQAHSLRLRPRRGALLPSCRKPSTRWRKGRWRWNCYWYWFGNYVLLCRVSFFVCPVFRVWLTILFQYSARWKGWNHRQRPG